MSDLIPTPGGFLPSRADRSAARAIQQIRATQAVATANEVAKLEVIQDVTTAAMTSASNMSAIEALLVERTPHAAGRLRSIADAGTLGLMDVVMKTSRAVK